MGRIALVLTVLAVVVASSSAIAIPVWSNAGWIPYTSGGQIYWDPFNDIAPEPLDIVGKDPVVSPPGFASLYWFLDSMGTASEADDILMFRMLIDEPPFVVAGNYAVMIDTDGTNLANWALQVDNITHNQVEFQQTDPGGPTWADIRIPTPEAPDNNPYEWTGSLIGWSQLTSVSTVIPGYVPVNGAADYFIDFAMPWQNFASAAGFTNQSTPIRLAATTSLSDNLINKDTPGTSGLGDPVTFGDPIIPEPSTMALLGLGLAGLLARRRRKAA